MNQKIYVISNRNGSLNEHAMAMAAGLERHGYDTAIVPKGSMPPEGSPFIVCWGWREGRRLREAGYNVLVMERGYVGDRYQWTSLGWNGLNGRATWNAPADNGERFERNFGHLLKPWKEDRSGYALLIGQVRGDAALQGIVIDHWYLEAADAIKRAGYSLKFRPHPEALRRGIAGNALMSCRLNGTLEEALDGASCVVTYNSNTGVEAALAGVPVIAIDKGSMAWPVASHGIDQPLVTPDRTEWCRRMAWRQWTEDEIASGLAWEHVGEVLVSMAEAANDRGRKGRTALIMAGGSRVREDVVDALKLFTPDMMIAVNDFGAEWRGRLDHWVSNHPEKMAGWADKRASSGLAPAGRIWTVTHKVDGHPYQHVVNPGGGSSATAVAVAREMGAERIVLAGVPLTPTPHFFDDVPWSAREVAHYQRAWQRQKKHMIKDVRSLSGGFTEKLLGRPTREWIEGLNGAQNAA
jgi:hypothetical protein